MTKLLLVFIFIFKLNVSWAQGTSGAGLSPAEMSEFKNNLAEMEAKRNEELRKQQEQKQKFTFPPPVPGSTELPNAAQAQTPPAQNPTAAPPPAQPAPPTLAPLPTSAPGSELIPPPTGGDLRSATIKPDGVPVLSDERQKSPFMIPNELYIKIKKKMGEKPNTVEVDDAVEVRLRWPLKDYKLVGVIYDTKKPKAMIADREGKVHVYREKELIANAGGYVAEINNGEVIVVEKGAEVKLQLKEK
jgi:hypothetical protein